MLSVIRLCTVPETHTRARVKHAPPIHPASRRPAVTCNASTHGNAASFSKRELFHAGAATLAGVALVGNARAEGAYNIKYLAVDQLGAFQRADQRKEFEQRAEAELKKVLSGADAPDAFRLVFNDAGTYDEATKTGGFDGSIVTEEELNRPENASLKPLVAKLAEAKKVIDAGGPSGQGPISWADLLVLAAKVATQKAWYDLKVNRAVTDSGGQLIATAFSAAWPVRLGRLDSAIPAPAGRIPPRDAPVQEIKNYLLSLGAKPSPGPFSPKPPFWERPGLVVWSAGAADPVAEEARLAAGNPLFKQFSDKYTISRGTLTRTDYEVDFITYLDKLTSLGAKFDPNAYLYPQPVAVPKNL